MPTTGSASQKVQSSLVDLKDGNAIKPQPVKRWQASKNKRLKSDKSHTKPELNGPAKRKSIPATQKHARPPEKKSKYTKQTHFVDTSDRITSLEKPIFINRSPVLQLWGASVAQFLYPSESWTACLSMGSGIASLCAVAKGKAVGAIEPKEEDTEEADGRQQNQKQEEKDSMRLRQVMSFLLYLENAAVMLRGKPKKLNGSLLKSKFGGEEHYEKAKETIRSALETWSNVAEELDKKAFHMYEKFRPSIAKGMSGWGRKGELNLHEVCNTVKKKS